MPVYVSELPFRSSMLPVVAVTVPMPAKRSAGIVVNELSLRSNHRNGMPWNRRGGSVVKEFPERLKCVAFVRYAKSFMSNAASFADAGDVLSGFRLRGFVSLVTTRLVRLVTETLRVSDEAVQSVSAVTAAGVVVTPGARSLSFSRRMISLATASVRVHRFTVCDPDCDRAIASV